jgi:hypothetical protein
MTMAYYIDMNSIKVEPTQEPNIYLVTADMTTQETGNDWEKTWTSVSCPVNKNDPDGAITGLQKEYKKLREKTTDQQMAIDAITSKIVADKNTKTFTRENPNPPEPAPQKVEIVAMKEDLGLKTDTVKESI